MQDHLAEAGVEEVRRFLVAERGNSGQNSRDRVADRLFLRPRLSPGSLVPAWARRLSPLSSSTVPLHTYVPQADRARFIDAVL
jgi:hypothetical protein